MSVENIIRAWKDPDYRQSLSAAALAALPAHPSGLIDTSLVAAGEAGEQIFVTTIDMLTTPETSTC
ncbi:MAG TPA: mersacidin/lichenicidin family type 2 lantibiotic [Pyrinomonadaceae bacterium]|jgi:mersacidin/lichenicidin family type 2 lantibiotic